ncbi:hypothetical protein X928_04545 [Petrotoga miotherma DSM 10691]|uniref:Uncharacterized protein n=1 Tax=Petrotoga miotherma DSM 10691 TaxID=1434326 RepID=A0A2K1PCM8_9BACT|nr:hypothetical protein X928_04545 [Petrotoga miotherma DSM 10691]RLL85440.1 hypothetical protein BZ25_03935 [Petrotoga sp. Shatin.DS.tank11.9.2.9.3]RLL88788.1 hypothetical protein CN13_07550 [Petrotoga sp. HKA.pet.4.5]
MIEDWHNRKTLLSENYQSEIEKIKKMVTLFTYLFQQIFFPHMTIKKKLLGLRKKKNEDNLSKIAGN